MNNLRRKRIQAVIDKLSDLKEEIDDIYNEEEEYRDNMPENLMESDRYSKADNAVENLDSSSTSLDEIIEYLESAME